MIRSHLPMRARSRYVLPAAPALSQAAQIQASTASAHSEGELTRLRAQVRDLTAQLSALQERARREDRIKSYLVREFDGLASFATRWALVHGRAPSRESRVIITTTAP